MMMGRKERARGRGQMANRDYAREAQANAPLVASAVHDEFSKILADLDVDLPKDESIVGSAPPVPAASAKSPLRRLKPSPFQRVPPYLQVLPTPGKMPNGACVAV